MTKELPWLLERRRKSGIVIVPVIFEPCPWRLDASLSQLQALPVDGRPVYDGDETQAQRHLTVIAEQLEKTLNPTAFEEWRSRPALSGPRRPTVLVSGPVGVGKTTFLLRLFSEHAEQADLVVRITGADLSAAMKRAHGDPRPLWGRLYEPFQPPGHPGLTPEAVAYALARRRTLLVVEDVHVAGPVAEALEFLRDYLARYHRPRRFRLLLTTREPLADNEASLPHDPEVIILEPLKGLEPAEFFWALCTRNGIELDAPEVRRALGDAFQHPTTGTPLFVVICAWLVVNVEEHRGNVERLLEMDRARIFGLFIKELYARSLGGSAPGSAGTPLRGYEPFLSANEQIALRYWPETGKIPVDDLDALLGRPGHVGGGWTTDWLIENGFLFRPPDNDRSTLSFRHQAVAEYLAAKAMIDAGDFRPLCEKVRATSVVR